jgi:hypothetical protein
MAPILPCHAVKLPEYKRTTGYALYQCLGSHILKHPGSTLPAIKTKQPVLTDKT